MAFVGLNQKFTAGRGYKFTRLLLTGPSQSELTRRLGFPHFVPFDSGPSFDLVLAVIYAVPIGTRGTWSENEGAYPRRRIVFN